MKNKKLRIKVTNSCSGNIWSIGVYEGKKHFSVGPYKHKSSAVKWAKRVSEQTGIKFSSEIIKKHDC